MFKLIFCMRRLLSRSLDEFQDYWLNRHAPLLVNNKDALGVKRYVQLHTLPGSLSDALRNFRDAPEPFDGVAEVWYESAEAFKALRHSTAARAAAQEMLDDEKRLIDHTRSPVWFADEKEIVPLGG